MAEQPEILMVNRTKTPMKLELLQRASSDAKPKLIRDNQLYNDNPAFMQTEQAPLDGLTNQNLL